MHRLKKFAAYARAELDSICNDALTAKQAYIAMLINGCSAAYGMDATMDDSNIPDYIKQKFSADVMSADIFDAEKITWLYQYFVNTDRRNTIDSIGGLETDNGRVAAATQVFTPQWITEYMIDNSLGRYWADINPKTSVVKKLNYYIPHRPKTTTATVDPCKITVFDPCCGCGNILMYAFDVLMLIYREAGYPDDCAAKSILEHNLFGADIDPCAAQIASFCLKAKACRYSNDLLNRDINPHIEVMSNGDIGTLAADGAPDSVTSMKFDIVCTNPPYLSRMSKELKEYTGTHLKPYSKDLFTAFMYRGLQYCKSDGYMAFMTPNVWMFLTSHKEIRQYVINNTSICTLFEAEKGSYFSEASVDICAFVIKNSPCNDEGIYIHPQTGERNLASQNKALVTAITMLRDGKECNYVYKRSNTHFDTIPENLLLYNADKRVIDLFGKQKIGDVFTVKQGMTTGNNKKFLRYWWQVPYSNIGFNCTDCNTAGASGKTWFPYNKGGKYRKWYGNNEYVVMYAEDGKEMKEYTSHLPQGTWVRLKSREYYFRQSVTWSFISSSKFGVRYSPAGSIFDVAGSSLFGENLHYVLGFLGSKVAYFLLQTTNPTMNYQIRDIKALPYIFDSSVANRVVQLTKKCIDISANEWNSHETSYDFFKNPLVQYSSGMQLDKAAEAYISSCTAAKTDMHHTETELNSIFINLYDMEHIISPDVVTEDITLPDITVKAAIQDLVSYCIGLYFNRFSARGGINPKYTPASASVDSIASYTQKYISQTFTRDAPKFVSHTLGADIATYIRKQFIKDHTKKYKNHPIYHIEGDMIKYSLGDDTPCQNTQP